MAAPYNVQKNRMFQNSVLIKMIGLYEPYHDISSVFISNKNVSIARKLCWIPHRQVAILNREGGGEWPNHLLQSFFFFSQASTITAKAITMIQAQTSWIFSGVLH